MELRRTLGRCTLTIHHWLSRPAVPLLAVSTLTSLTAGKRQSDQQTSACYTQVHRCQCLRKVCCFETRPEETRWCTCEGKLPSRASACVTVLLSAYISDFQQREGAFVPCVALGFAGQLGFTPGACAELKIRVFVASQAPGPFVIQFCRLKCDVAVPCTRRDCAGSPMQQY